MFSRDIPQNSWGAFFNGLSAQYRGWRVSIEVTGREVGHQMLGIDLPLQGISYDRVGSAADDILIGAGDSSDDYMAHHVDHPCAVRMAEMQPGGDMDVEFESSDGIKTIIHL